MDPWVCSNQFWPGDIELRLKSPLFRVLVDRRVIAGRCSNVPEVVGRAGVDELGWPPICMEVNQPCD